MKRIYLFSLLSCLVLTACQSTKPTTAPQNPNPLTQRTLDFSPLKETQVNASSYTDFISSLCPKLPCKSEKLILAQSSMPEPNDGSPPGYNFYPTLWLLKNNQPLFIGLQETHTHYTRESLVLSPSKNYGLATLDFGIEGGAPELDYVFIDFSKNKIHIRSLEKPHFTGLYQSSSISDDGSATIDLMFEPEITCSELKGDAFLKQPYVIPTKVNINDTAAPKALCRNAVEVKNLKTPERGQLYQKCSVNSHNRKHEVGKSDRLCRPLKVFKADP